MLPFVLGVLIGLDRDVHHNVQLLVEFFVSFMSDGLMLLTTWEIMEIVPETVSGTALGLSTACTSGTLLSKGVVVLLAINYLSTGLVLSLPFIFAYVYDDE